MKLSKTQGTEWDVQSVNTFPKFINNKNNFKFEKENVNLCVNIRKYK